MRLRIVFLLVAALLLKGWAGEAMAGQMIAAQLHDAAAVAAMQAAHGDECPGHAASHDGTAHSASCEQCQACSLHALPVVVAVPVVQQAQAVALPIAVQFASAEARRDHKPPVL